MDKFSNYIKNSKVIEKTEDILFQKGDYKLREAEGWVYMDEPDMVIAIPYIVDENEIILRYEYIPTYKVRDNKDNYLTVLSGSLKKGEKHLDCLFREIQEETGMAIRPNVEVKLLGDLFVSKGCKAKYHIYFIEVYNSDFEQLDAVGDGSEAEEKSQTIRIPVSHITQLKCEDTITAFCVEFLKNHFQL